MAEHFASGNWHVTKGKEQEFVERWTEFLGWTRATRPSLVEASLIRDESDPSHFVSFARFASAEERNAWKQSGGFMERFGACRALTEDFHGGDYHRAVAV
jgi:heme-degrading monooxygenase HmoA